MIINLHGIFTTMSLATFTNIMIVQKGGEVTKPRVCVRVTNLLTYKSG